MVSGTAMDLGVGPPAVRPKSSESEIAVPLELGRPLPPSSEPPPPLIGRESESAVANMPGKAGLRGLGGRWAVGERGGDLSPRDPLGLLMGDKVATLG